jgi:hypothetical protein
MKLADLKTMSESDLKEFVKDRQLKAPNKGRETLVATVLLHLMDKNVLVQVKENDVADKLQGLQDQMQELSTTLKNQISNLAAQVEQVQCTVPLAVETAAPGAVKSYANAVTGTSASASDDLAMIKQELQLQADRPTQVDIASHLMFFNMDENAKETSKSLLEAVHQVLDKLPGTNRSDVLKVHRVGQLRVNPGPNTKPRPVCVILNSDKDNKARDNILDCKAELKKLDCKVFIERRLSAVQMQIRNSLKPTFDLLRSEGLNPFWAGHKLFKQERGRRIEVRTPLSRASAKPQPAPLAVLSPAGSPTK